MHPSSPIRILLEVLWSRGTPLKSSINIRYMAQLGSKCPLHAAVLLAPTFNIGRALGGFARNPVTRSGAVYCANQVKQMYTSASDKFAAAGFPMDQLPPPKGPYIGDLYEVLMPHLTGHSYQEFTETLLTDLEVGIPNITVPTFYVGSYRDEVAGVETKLLRAVEKNPNFIRLMTQGRSHLGYFSGFIKPKRWAQKPIFEFIQVFSQQHYADCRLWQKFLYEKTRWNWSGLIISMGLKLFIKLFQRRTIRTRNLVVMARR